MKKVAYIISILLIISIPMVLTSCAENNEVPIEQIIELSKPYADDSQKLTKHDIAIWLVQIVKKKKDSKYELNSESNQDLFGKAVSWGFLQGSDDSSLDDEALANREEAFLMVNNAFNIRTNVDIYSLQDYRDFNDVSKWARQSTANIVNILVNDANTSLLDDGIQPKKHILQKDMRDMIKSVITSKAYSVSNKSLWEVLSESAITLWDIIVFLSSAGILTALFIFIKFIKKQRRIKKELILIGETACGKSQLHKVLLNPHRPQIDKQYTPTRGVRKSKAMRIVNDEGTILADYSTRDTPGESNDILLELLKGHKFRRKIILLILAHNQSDSSQVIDGDYLMKQYTRINQVYLPAMRHYSNRIYKIIVFINKYDTLPDHYQNGDVNIQEDIYGNHLRLIEDACSDKIRLEVLVGSAARHFHIEGLQKALL